MRSVLTLILSIGFAFNSFAQSALRLTLSWNEASSRYEVYALSNSNLKNYAIANSQISIVMPNSAPDVKLNLKSVNGGQWVDSKFLTSPGEFAQFDYHAISTNGGIMNFTANQGVLLFSFTFADSECRDGVRLYNNSADPNSSTKGFNGLNFSNTILGVGNVEVYSGNISNTGTKCGNCPVEFDLPILKKKST